MLYRIAQEHGNTSFSWENLEREVESKAGLPKNSLNGKLQQLEAPLVASKQVYDKVLVSERVSDRNFDKMVDNILTNYFFQYCNFKNYDDEQK